MYSVDPNIVTPPKVDDGFVTIETAMARQLSLAYLPNMASGDEYARIAPAYERLVGEKEHAQR